MLSGGQTTLGTIAVLSFFIVSGFLITGSLVKHPSLARFCIHRLARVLPGFWVSLLVITFLVAPLAIDSAFPGRWTYAERLRLSPFSSIDYLAHNWTLQVKQYTIGPLFLGNPAGGTVNGSLWTLYHEALCWAALGLVSFCGGLRSRRFLLAVAGLIYVVHIFDFVDHFALLSMSPETALAVPFLFSRMIRPLYLAFLAGVLCWQYRSFLRWESRWFVVAVLLFLGSLVAGGFSLIWPFTLPYIVLWLAQRLPFQRMDRWGDYSFGVYIYAFPIQQCLVMTGLHLRGVTLYFAACLLASLVAGAVSWFLVEKPALALGWRLARSRGGRQITRGDLTAAVDLAAPPPARAVRTNAV